MIGNFRTSDGRWMVSGLPRGTRQSELGRSEDEFTSSRALPSASITVAIYPFVAELTDEILHSDPAILYSMNRVIRASAETHSPQ
jgi:hypothetical protein